MNLKQLRSQIDAADKKIIRLLNMRARITLNIAKLKLNSGKGIYSPDREREVLQKLKEVNQGPLDSRALGGIYREIMSASLALGSAPKIAYLGPQASFTHLAALSRFGSLVEYLPCNSIADVFSEVEKDNAHYGVVPIENSIEGVVSYTLDMFVDSDLLICSQIVLDVAHNLLANYPKNKIRLVYSHPQVFGQCRTWLAENLPHAQMIEVSSTTAAAKIAAGQKNSACIASLLAAKVYKLRVLVRDIEDSPHNITRFLVIGKAQVPQTPHDRTSIMFSIKDKVGALHDMLVPFKKCRINLTKIESRPSKKRAWDYYFFVDLEGHHKNPRVKKALLELENKCKFLKVLGSYPVGE